LIRDHKPSIRQGREDWLEPVLAVNSQWPILASDVVAGVRLMVVVARRYSRATATATVIWRLLWMIIWSPRSGG
jgi:hypothetical protein